MPGSRAVRLRYSQSPDSFTRYDALQVAWLSRHLMEDAAIDVGAHTAHKCCHGGKVWSDRSCLAIEPDPYSHEVLVRNIGLNSGIKRPTVEVCACSDEIGEAMLFCRSGNSQSSLARSAVDFLMRTGPRRFECRSSLSILICRRATGQSPVA